VKRRVEEKGVGKEKEDVLLFHFWLTEGKKERDGEERKEKREGARKKKTELDGSGKGR